MVNKNLSNEAAVYVIYINGKLSYVGHSNTPKFRFSGHSFQHFHNYKTPWGECTDLYCKIKYPTSYGKEAMIEKRLIRRLKPRCNIYKYKKKRVIKEKKVKYV